MKPSEIEDIVIDELRALLEDPDRESTPGPDAVAGPARLGDDLGLSSLDLAELVTVLEMELEADPFRELVPITSVRTVGDLVAAYGRALSGETAEDAPDPAAEEAAARARARKSRQADA